LDFGFQQCGEVREWGLLLADRLSGERAEPGADRGEVQLAGVWTYLDSTESRW